MQILTKKRGFYYKNFSQRQSVFVQCHWEKMYQQLKKPKLWKNCIKFILPYYSVMRFICGIKLIAMMHHIMPLAEHLLKSC